MQNNQTHWYLLTGLVFGIAIGLVISLLIVPAVHREALPAELSPNAKNAYRAMIASTYQTDFNLERAQSRLALLGDADPGEALIAQAQEVIASGGSEEAARALAQLAAALDSLPVNPTSTP